MSDINETTVIAAEPAGRNPAVLALAVLGALVAGALVWFFVAAPLLQGDDADESAAAPAAAVADVDATIEPSADAAVDAAEAVDEAALPVVTYEVFIDRDPFDPVVPEPVSDTQPVSSTDDGTTDDGATDGGTTDGGSTDGGTTDGGTTDDGATDGGTTDGGCTAGDEVVCDGRVVSLVDIRTAGDGERVAIVQVDTTLYEVGVGDIFAASFEVRSISGDTVYLLYGDDAFELTVGDRVLK